MYLTESTVSEPLSITADSIALDGGQRNWRLKGSHHGLLCCEQTRINWEESGIYESWRFEKGSGSSVNCGCGDEREMGRECTHIGINSIAGFQFSILESRWWILKDNIWKFWGRERGISVFFFLCFLCFGGKRENRKGSL